MAEMQKNIGQIKLSIIEKIGNPVDVMVVLATIESLGIRDMDVYPDYGFVNKRELARHIYEDLKKLNPKNLLNSKEKLGKQENLVPVSGYLWVKFKILAKSYPLGLFYLLPIFLQIATIIFFGYSLWAYVGFNDYQSTAVILGVILGLIISGGYIQVMGRQASFYWNYKKFQKGKMVIDKIISSGIKGMLIVFLALGLISIFFNLYPIFFLGVVFCYAFLIGLLLLHTAPFYTLKQRWAISLIIIIASIVALTLKFYTNLHIYITHWIGIILAIILCKLVLVLYFKKYKANYVSTNTKPKKLMVIYRNYNYFFYGLFIYCFVFIDRIIAWSGDIGFNHKFIFLYEKNYEIGMDLAIIVFFLLAGVLEYAIASFSKFLDIRQKNTPFVNAKLFNDKFIKMYRNHVLLLFSTALVIFFLLYLIIIKPWGYQAYFGEELNEVSLKICCIGAIGYFFLTWGMLNALYLFTLNQPKNILKALIIAWTINFGSGYILCRTIGYEYSVLGMLIGSIIFMLLTLKATLQFFKKLDFYYYAAY